MKKKYGQNFLINKSIVKEIIEVADIKSSRTIINKIQNCEGKVELCKTGHANIKNKMINSNAH